MLSKHLAAPRPGSKFLNKGNTAGGGFPDPCPK